MKKVTLFLASLALVLGLAACKEPNGGGGNSTKGLTNVKVDPAELELRIGLIHKLQVSWEPSSAKPELQFHSDNKEVATVTNDGVVKAIAEGKATITVHVGTQEVTCKVTVLGSDAPVPLPEKSELPYLKFGAGILDEQQGNFLDADVKKHEEGLGRKFTPLVQAQPNVQLPGLVNKELSTIPAVLYSLQAGKYDIIIAHSKESFNNLAVTEKMLQEAGFTAFEEKENKDGSKYKSSENAKTGVSAEAIEFVVKDLSTQTAIWFFKDKPFEFIKDVKDIPTIEKLLADDAEGIKSYEAEIGFRNLIAQHSSDKQLVFEVKQERMEETNLYFAVYVLKPSKGPKFIYGRLRGIYDFEQLKSDNMKNWLAANGYDKDFNEGKLANGEPMVIAYKEADGKVYQAMAYMEKQKDGGSLVPMIQIAEKQQQAASKGVYKLRTEEMPLSLLDSYSPFRSKHLSTLSIAK